MTDGHFPDIFLLYSMTGHMHCKVLDAWGKTRTSFTLGPNLSCVQCRKQKSLATRICSYISDAVALARRMKQKLDRLV